MGRDALIEQFGVSLRRAVSGRPGKSVMPVGLHGVGKTVLLNCFHEIARDEGLRVGFIEAPETGDFRRLLATRLRAILLDLDRGKVSRTVARALGTLKAFAYTLPDGGSISTDVDAVVGRADSGTLSEDVTDLLVATGEAAKDRSTGVVIAIDEVQYLSGEELGAMITATATTRSPRS